MKELFHKSLAVMLLFTLLLCVGCGQGATDVQSVDDKQTVTDVSADITETPTEAPEMQADITETPIEAPIPTESPVLTETPTSTEAPVPTATPALTEPPHEHAYTESITKEASCTEAGEKSFVCECGDTYTEQIEVIGHSFGNYVFNNDATYNADGTETATCVCGLTDTRTVKGSKLEYTYTDLAKTMYAKSSVNVRDLPSTDGEKLGGLTKAQEVDVTGQCKETGWYRIKYNGSTGYVSDSYLQNDKPVEATPTPEPEPTFTDEFEISNPDWYLGDDGIYYCYTFTDAYSEWNGKTLAEYCAATNTGGVAFNGPFMDMVRFPGDKFGDYVFGSHWIVSYTRIGREIELQLPF